MQVPKCYMNWAKAMIESFWNKPLDKGQSPFMSKAQIRQQITSGIERFVAENGDPTTWTHCKHCDGTGLYIKIGPDQAQVGVFGQPDMIETEALCYQCWGKGRQSEADRRRNWGYQERRKDREG
jgi:hypothetical protein